MLTKINPDGTWSCRGVNWNEISGNVYGALCKLRDYELSGFEPDGLYRINERIHIGSVIQGYAVISIYGQEHCLAENKISGSYVVWNIDASRCGVNSGYYCRSREEAERNYFSRCFRWFNEPEEDYDMWSLEDETPVKLSKFLNLNSDDCKEISLFAPDEKSAVCRKLFEGTASELIAVCLDSLYFRKYLDWYVRDFSADAIYISEKLI